MNHTQNESTIHSRYENLYRTYSTAKDRINGLKKLKDKISEKKYKSLYDENKAIVDNMGPQLDSLKKEIYSIINNITNKIKIIKADINHKNTKIQEFETLFNANIIDELNYRKNVAPLKRQRNSLQDSLERKNQEILNLRTAIESPPGKSDKSKNPSYIKRFFSYLAFSQLLCLIFYGAINVLPVEYFIISLIATSAAFAIAGISLIFNYLFKHIKLHAKYLIFSGIGYLILSDVFFSQLFDKYKSIIYFFNLILIWNLSFSVLILIVCFLRVALPWYRNYERSLA